MAASVWLTHRVLPLRADGHGRLMAGHLAHARRLWERLGTIQFGDRRVIPFMPGGPDSNLVLFVGHDASWPATIPALNEFNASLATVLEPTPPSGYPLVTRPTGTAFVSRTELSHDKFRFSSFAPMPAAHGVTLREDDYTAEDAPALTVLRLVCADLYAGAPGTDPDPVGTVAEHIRDALLGVG